MAKNVNVVSGWAFLIGVVLAVLLGLFGRLNATMIWVLILVGIIVGLLNIADKEASPFLMSSAVLIIASSLGAKAVEAQLGAVLSALLAIFVPAAIVVAIRNVFSLAKN
jgi:uncharacterized membrane protein